MRAAYTCATLACASAGLLPIGSLPGAEAGALAMSIEAPPKLRNNNLGKRGRCQVSRIRISF